MHETELGRAQLVVEVQPVALPEHMGHRVKVCYHFDGSVGTKEIDTFVLLLISFILFE
jgi:hypothetical protein